jgi:riboflavin kinase/FMN adenylyltransferase
MHEADRRRGGAGRLVATVGTFDGVHVGHQRLIDETRRQAVAAGLRSVAVTFDRHPLTVVRPEAAPRLLTGLEHKLELLRARGVDVVVLAFDAARAAQSAEDFVESVLVDELGVAAVVVGSSFRFGHRHRGNVALLETVGARLGFSVTSIELVTDDEVHTVVSSSLIRSLVEGARLDEARRLLGRDHEVRGEVGAGPARVAIPAELVVPPAGEYRAAWSTAASTGTGIVRVPAAPRAGPTVLELHRDAASAGDGARDELAEGEPIAVRFAAPVDPMPPSGGPRLTNRAGRHR